MLLNDLLYFPCHNTFYLIATAPKIIVLIGMIPINQFIKSCIFGTFRGETGTDTAAY